MHEVALNHQKPNNNKCLDPLPD